MFIAIWAGGMPFNGETIPEGKSLGGSESAAYCMARELNKLGHNVIIFTASPKTGNWDGVQYEYIGQTSREYPLGDRFEFVMQAPHDVVIVQRHPFAFVKPMNSKINILWLHDLALMRHGGAMQASLPNLDLVFTVSDFHRQQVSEVYGIDPNFVHATKNGIDYSMFEEIINAKKIEREPNSLIYTARPERGLENLVGKDSIMERLPNAHLYVCGYDNTVPQMRSYYEYLWSRCEELPNVTNLGSLGKKELYFAEAKAMLHVYPTEFEDTSCIAALEAQAAGTPFLSSQIAALPETLQGGGAVLLPLKKKRVDKDKFAETVNKFLGNKERWERYHKMSLEKRQPWSDVAHEWSELFKEILMRKSADPERLRKHLEHNSDIMAAIHAGFDMREKYAFAYGDGQAFKEHYDKVYDYEAERGVVYGAENLSGNARFETVLDIIDKEIKSREENKKEDEKRKEYQILDYGCAHGHYVMNIWSRTKGVFNRLHGIDINERNIKAANKWRGESSAIDVEFDLGTEALLTEKDQYDVIMANEVLEHVADPGKLITALLKHLKDDGIFIGTVPYGAWEAIGYEKHTLRAHIHHFEREDLRDLFKDQKMYKLTAIPHRGSLGHFAFWFKKSDKPIGTIDYDRKLREQAPRETLSVCMIARDAEYTIGKTLERVKRFADEIIVGIDELTTDETERIVKRFTDKIFTIKSPMEIGFDEARNLTIDRAVMDWIFWIDSDEILEYNVNVPKYLRANPLAGYAVKQHHVGVEPLGCSKTDLPIRLFRNHRGIRFYGCVHEHPEKEYNSNEGVGRSNMIHDFSILHAGYSTEQARRIRFMRNFPLMKKDREKYPDRVLGKFLWLRDLSHTITYDAERNGGKITLDMRQRAEEIINLWRFLASKGDYLRYCVDSLQFYSQAVHVTGGGIEFAFNVGASSLNGGAKLDDKETRGLFKNSADIKRMMNMIIHDRTKMFEEKYF